MSITIIDNFERVAVDYVEKVASEEMIGVLAKGIRKQARKIAREIIENMEINVVLKDVVGENKQSLGTRVRKKENDNPLH